MSKHSLLHFLPEALRLHVSRRPKIYIPTGTILVIGAFVFFLLLLPPSGFPKGEIIVIEEGVPFSVTARTLEERYVVNSAFMLQVLARVGGADETIQAGKYVFEKPVGLTTVLYRLAHGVSGMPMIKVTFPEGTTVKEMARILNNSLPSFDEELFLELGSLYEGYLFPDTYYVDEDTSPYDMLIVLQKTFNEKTATLREKNKERSFEDVVVMASLIEREAIKMEDKKMISGILWNRVAQGRALQVDAVFGYIHGVQTFHPSLDDLEVDSPYNTYKYPGLPIGPISNPGLDSLQAALSPTESDYLYYLTGTDGNMYYARTFEEHKENRSLYLD